jgi:hypothetical protein
MSLSGNNLAPEMRQSCRKIQPHFRRIAEITDLSAASQPEIRTFRSVARRINPSSKPRAQPSQNAPLPSARFERKPMTDLERALLLSPLLALAAPTYGHSQPATCLPRAALVEDLGTRYGETPQSIGLGSNNALMELFASRETGIWTIALTLPNGQSCLIASGQAFETLQSAPKPPRA